jgi:Uma2 family endonuclease
MATISRVEVTDESCGDQTVALRGVGWSGYQALLRLRGERAVPKLIYLDGDLWLVSPSFPHERLAERPGLLVMVVVEELDIPCVPAGSTTLRRRKKSAGVEGDKSFYFVNEAKVRGKDKIRLRFDPPPDLAIEAVSTHDASAALEVYRRLRVSEVWICDESGLHVLVRQPSGRSAESAISLAFPFLPASEIGDWAHRPQTNSETEWIRELRRWVRETVLPRYRTKGG